MQGPFTSTCPLCGSSCQLFKTDYEQWHHFRCVCCREIKINARFVDEIRSTPVDERTAIAKQALGIADNQVLTITRDLTNPGGWTWALRLTERHVM
jgi:phosphatidylserine decarboxylase